MKRGHEYVQSTRFNHKRDLKLLYRKCTNRVLVTSRSRFRTPMYTLHRPCLPSPPLSRSWIEVCKQFSVRQRHCSPLLSQNSCLGVGLEEVAYLNGGPHVDVSLKGKPRLRQKSLYSRHFVVMDFSLKKKVLRCWEPNTAGSFHYNQ